MLRCPRCGSTRINVAAGGLYRCADCGHTWPIPTPDTGWIEEEVSVWKLYEEEVKNALQEIDCSKLIERLTNKGVRDPSRVAFLVLRRVASLLRYFPHLRKRALDESEKCFPSKS